MSWDTFSIIAISLWNFSNCFLFQKLLNRRYGVVLKVRSKSLYKFGRPLCFASRLCIDYCQCEFLPILSLEVRKYLWNISMYKQLFLLWGRNVQGRGSMHPSQSLVMRANSLASKSRPSNLTNIPYFSTYFPILCGLSTKKLDLSKCAFDWKWI